MKPGDKVWLFRPNLQKIEQGKIVKPVFEDIFEIPLGDGCRCGGIPFVSIFPTRELLCEHYRKIFGGIDRKVLLDGINALKKDAKERHEDDCYLHGLYDVMDMINEELG